MRRRSSSVFVLLLTLLTISAAGGEEIAVAKDELTDGSKVHDHTPLEWIEIRTQSNSAQATARQKGAEKSKAAHELAETAVGHINYIGSHPQWHAMLARAGAIRKQGEDLEQEAAVHAAQAQSASLRIAEIVDGIKARSKGSSAALRTQFTVGKAKAAEVIGRDHLVGDIKSAEDATQAAERKVGDPLAYKAAAEVCISIKAARPIKLDPAQGILERGEVVADEPPSLAEAVFVEAVNRELVHSQATC